MKLNRDTKRAWIKALKSGKYRRGRNRILTRNQCGTYYNAIGVLLDISGGIRRYKDGTTTVVPEVLDAFSNNYSDVYLDLMDLSMDEDDSFSTEISYIKENL